MSEVAATPPGLLVRRLAPGTDLREALQSWCRESGIDAAVPVSMVGSLKVASIRFAGKDEPAKLEGPFEIVAATGTMGSAGIHVHLMVADSKGRVTGGHLSAGSLINTTVEVAALDFSRSFRFERKPDARTGCYELFPVAKSTE
ncbi:MAG: DNA-binding protein [Cyanobacteria bacterium HKST-UBA02]|nr:DNA-binding protein [Cyanobacteria bacterium HKST-UBA02]